MFLPEGIKEKFEEMDRKKEAKQELKDLANLYEVAYERARTKHPEYPELKTFAWEKSQNLEEYANDIGYGYSTCASSLKAAYMAIKKAVKENPDISAKELYIVAGKEIHDDWCVDNQHKYHDPLRADRQWQFLSSEAIGWDEFSKDLVYAEIAMKYLGYPALDDEFSKEVKSAFNAGKLKLDNMSYKDQIATEIDRWVDLNKEYAERNKDILETDYYLVLKNLPKYEDIDKEDNSKLTSLGYQDANNKLDNEKTLKNFKSQMIGAPYDLTREYTKTGNLFHDVSVDVHAIKNDTPVRNALRQAGITARDFETEMELE